MHDSNCGEKTCASTRINVIVIPTIVIYFVSFGYGSRSSVTIDKIEITDRNLLMEETILDNHLKSNHDITNSHITIIDISFFVCHEKSYRPEINCGIIYLMVLRKISRCSVSFSVATYFLSLFR